MKKIIGLWLLWTTVTVSAQTTEESRPRQKDPESYENPVLSLLLLPVKVLMKIGSVFAPGEGDEPGRGPRPPSNSSD
jgi:hypothetical protein